MMKVEMTVHTDASGYWTEYSGEVRVTEIYLNHLFKSDGKLCGSLHALLKDWNYEENGIPYTDLLWLKEFKEAITLLGGNDDFCYSEAGLQGEDFVDLDVDDNFLSSDLGKKLIEEYSHQNG